MNSRHPVLLVRPKPQESEEVAEYVQRLAKANGFSYPDQMISLWGCSINQMDLAGHEMLRDVICGRLPGNALSQLVTKSGRFGPYHSDRGVGRHARVCGSCLRECDVLDARWSDPLAIICAEHREFLLDQCPLCGKEILQTTSMYRCQCGLNFRDHSPNPMADWVNNFHELFVPWQIGTQTHCRNTELRRYERIAVKFLRKAINKVQEAESIAARSIVQCRISSDDHPVLERLTRIGFSQLNTCDAGFKASTRLIHCWERNFHQLPKEAPGILEDIRRHKRERLVKTHLCSIQKKQAALKTADTISNVARLIGCHFRTATKLVQSPDWRHNIRAQANLEAHASLCSCVEKILAESISLCEFNRVSGMPRDWLGHFARSSPEIIKLGPECFSYWRILNVLARKLIGHIAACKMLAFPAEKYRRGFVRIADVGKNALQLQEWIQDALFSESLPLIYEQSALPNQLVDFSIPVDVINKNFRPRCKRELHMALKSARYPAVTNLVPDQLDAISA